MISCSIHCRWILYESNLNAANPIWLTFSKRHSWGSKLVDVSSKGIGAEGQWKRQAGPQPKSSTANNRVCRDVLNLDPVLPCNINIYIYVYIYICIVNIWGYIHVYIYIYIYIYTLQIDKHIKKQMPIKNHQKMSSKNTEPGNDGGYILLYNSWKHVSIYWVHNHH